MVKVSLLTAKWCPQCPSVKEIWRELKQQYDFEYEEVDITSDRGKELVKQNEIKSVPITLIDGNVVFVGIPDKEEAVLAVQNKVVVLGEEEVDREL
jgi:glutaredoxin